MPDTIIENPILNSPFREPDRHWRFTDEGITNDVVETRRASAYFVPIPPPKKKGKQLQFGKEKSEVVTFTAFYQDIPALSIWWLSPFTFVTFHLRQPVILCQ